MFVSCIEGIFKVLDVSVPCCDDLEIIGKGSTDLEEKITAIIPPEWRSSSEEEEESEDDQ